MLRVTLDLHGARTKQRHALGELLIWNVSEDPTRTVAEYDFVIKAEDKVGEGRVEHERALGAWELVRKCLSQNVRMETHSIRLAREVAKQLAEEVAA